MVPSISFDLSRNADRQTHLIVPQRFHSSFRHVVEAGGVKIRMVWWGEEEREESDI
jgi:hypothetical protein